MLGSPVDIALVCGIALIVFGPRKLPELGRSVGLGLANFKSALNQTANQSNSGCGLEASDITPTVQPSSGEKASFPSVAYTDARQRI